MVRSIRNRLTVIPYLCLALLGCVSINYYMRVRILGDSRIIDHWSTALHKTRILTTPTPPEVSKSLQDRRVQQIEDLIAGEMLSAARENQTAMDKFVADRKGKAPVRVLLLSHRRAGSSFVGNTIASHLGTYYVFEPLFTLLPDEVREDPEANAATFILESLFKCDFDNLGVNYTTNLTRSPWFFQRNERLLVCNDSGSLYSDPSFLSHSCRLFPVQLIQEVRYRLGIWLTKLLENEALENLRIVYLIRDPRAILNSRIRPSDCFDFENARLCDPLNVRDQAQQLCDDLVREFHVGEELRRKYPERFTILRYESIAQNPFHVTRDLFKFLHLMYTRSTEQYLKAHTTLMRVKGVFSTFRDSKANAEKWKVEWIGKRSGILKDVEMICLEAMELWGYSRITV